MDTTKNNQEPAGITDKKVPLVLMKRGRGAHLVALNNTLVYGEFPSSASSVFETSISLARIANAFSVQELEDMLKYRKNSVT